MRCILLAWVLTASAAPSFAMTLMQAKFVCPIGGERFKQEVVASSTQFGTNLDLKPNGPTPAPWPLIECPKNGFVFQDGKEFTSAEKATLAPFVASAEYQAMVAAKESTYFRAAMLARHVDPKADVAWTLLRATWQVDADPALYRRYAEAALQAFRDNPAPADPAEVETNMLVMAELLRRLERFEEANAALDAMPVPTDETVERVIAFQRELIASRDAKPHAVPAAHADAAP